MVPVLLVPGHIPKVPTMLAFVAPAPSPPQSPAPMLRSIEPEAAGWPSFEEVAGGIEGGVPGGIAGGLVGGLPEPPPPPPVLEAQPPIRVGGKIQAPTLLHRVEPFYPPVAVSARLQGLVILEALVDRDGSVADVKVLRSAGSVLDREALTAVRQWRYSPLLQNGQPRRFVLTVMLSFSVESKR